MYCEVVFGAAVPSFLDMSPFGQFSKHPTPMPLYENEKQVGGSLV